MPNSSLTLDRFLTVARSRYCAAAVLAFCIFSYFYIDQWLAWHTIVLPAEIIRIGNQVTKLGVGLTYFIALPVLVLITKFLFKNDLWCRRFIFLFSGILIASLICEVIKFTVGRTRPILLYTKKLYGFYFFHSGAPYHSFPSGHSTLIMALMLGLALLFSRYWVIFLLIALLVGASRLVVSAHYLSDVIAGLYLSVWVVPWLYQKFSFHPQGRLKVGKSYENQNRTSFSS